MSPRPTLRIGKRQRTTCCAARPTSLKRSVLVTREVGGGMSRKEKSSTGHRRLTESSDSIHPADRFRGRRREAAYTLTTLKVSKESRNESRQNESNWSRTSASFFPMALSSTPIALLAQW